MIPQTRPYTHSFMGNASDVDGNLLFKVHHSTPQSTFIFFALPRSGVYKLGAVLGEVWMTCNNQCVCLLFFTAWPDISVIIIGTEIEHRRPQPPRAYINPRL